MNKIIFTLFLSVFFQAQAQVQSPTDLQTVGYVDPVKYVGRWFQMAHNPLPFDPKKCVCTQQSLKLTPENKIEVFNSCNEDSETGPLREIRGLATTDDATNAKLTVDFGLPRKGQYWVIALAEDYSWAVVSDPSRFSLYILSKTPELNKDAYTKAVNQAALQVDISKLEVTDQKNCVYPQ